MGKDLAGDFKFGLPIHAGKNVHRFYRQSWIGIAVKSNCSVISAVARINNGGNAELACMWLATVAVRIYDLPARRRIIPPAAGLTTRSVVRGPGFCNLRRTTRVFYRSLLAGMRPRRVLLKTGSAGADDPIRVVAVGYDGNRSAAARC